MNDVKEICALALEAPAPPLRPAEQALTMARQATRRRARFALSAGGAMVFVLAGSVAMLPASTRPFAPAGQKPVGQLAAAPAPWHT